MVFVVFRVCGSKRACVVTCPSYANIRASASLMNRTYGFNLPFFVKLVGEQPTYCWSPALQRADPYEAILIYE